jgi:hypothetical protein
MGARRQLRNAAANVQTISGQINALTSTQRDKIIAALTERGIDIADVQAELVNLVTLSDTILAQVADTPDIL